MGEQAVFSAFATQALLQTIDSTVPKHAKIRALPHYACAMHQAVITSDPTLTTFNYVKLHLINIHRNNDV